MLAIITGILVSYLLGSLPTAYIFGRLLKGIDIRNFGSGNVGATNALRVLGRGPGIAVLILDMLKGFLSVAFLGGIIADKTTYIPQDLLYIILGISCICGHNWTLFLRFKGGKGIATTFGALAGLAVKISSMKLIFGLTILTWLIIFIICRVVSLASILSGIALPIYMLLFRQSPVLIASGILLSLFILLRHKSNLKRLFQGKEPRLNF
ncbi:MAG: glycerol-3-phosphate 1-O-acyltransferase PlsY [Candidatus Omnitrophica bacterium]|nr:glycerol-3-phosphate 1-O-acyltransferase PlsY [Candidatus Omnitrophota bacterium]